MRRYAILLLLPSDDTQPASLLRALRQNLRRQSLPAPTPQPATRSCLLSVRVYRAFDATAESPMVADVFAFSDHYCTRISPAGCLGELSSGDATFSGSPRGPDCPSCGRRPLVGLSMASLSARSGLHRSNLWPRHEPLSVDKAAQEEVVGLAPTPETAQLQRISALSLRAASPGTLPEGVPVLDGIQRRPVS